jgi:hypothetical protein
MKWEVLDMNNIEVGDIIKLKMDATMECLTNNYWNGCQSTTLRFIRNAYNGRKYEVISIFNDMPEVMVNGELCMVNKNIVELVEKKKQVKEYTMKELQDKLGEEFKLIK